MTCGKVAAFIRLEIFSSALVTLVREVTHLPKNFAICFKCLTEDKCICFLAFVSKPSKRSNGGKTIFLVRLKCSTIEARANQTGADNV